MWSKVLDMAQSHAETPSQELSARFVNQAQQSDRVDVRVKDLKSLPANQMLLKKKAFKNVVTFQHLAKKQSCL